MSDVTPAIGLAPMGPLRTLAVRIHDDLRAQLDVIAQLNDRSVTEEIRFALEAWVQTSKSDPNTLKRAESVRAEIEREAETKRNAIASIFGTPEAATPARSAAARPKQADA
jgi:uncharacterized membrane-anchored protein YjiN (DUF445 family)